MNSLDKGSGWPGCLAQAPSPAPSDSLLPPPVRPPARNQNSPPRLHRLPGCGAAPPPQQRPRPLQPEPRLFSAGPAPSPASALAPPPGPALHVDPSLVLAPTPATPWAQAFPKNLLPFRLPVGLPLSMSGFCSRRPPFARASAPPRTARISHGPAPAGPVPPPGRSPRPARLRLLLAPGGRASRALSPSSSAGSRAWGRHAVPGGPEPLRGALPAGAEPQGGGAQWAAAG